jgi:hypothetical protein
MPTCRFRTVTDAKVWTFADSISYTWLPTVGKGVAFLEVRSFVLYIAQTQIAWNLLSIQSESRQYSIEISIHRFVVECVSFCSHQYVCLEGPRQIGVQCVVGQCVVEHLHYSEIRNSINFWRFARPIGLENMAVQCCTVAPSERTNRIALLGTRYVLL